MRLVFAVILTAVFVTSCKTASNQSAIRSVVATDANDTSKVFVYYMDGNEVVYRKSCTLAQVASPANCPTVPSTAEMSWKNYRAALMSQGISLTMANGIGESMASQTAWDSTGNQTLVQQMETAFGINVTQSQNPFPNTFIGVPKNGSVQIPLPTTTSMALAVDLVAFEMKDAFDYFGSSDQTFRGSTHPFPSDAIVSSGVMTACFGNAPGVPHWSDIVFHYYCQLGAIRGCFTGKVSGGPKTYDHYKKGYDDCLANDDGFKRYFDGNVPGVNYDQRRQVFQHVMFSVYAAGKTGVFDIKEQDKAINERYGSSVGNCSSRPHLKRSSSDPLLRVQGQHCGDAQSGAGNGNTGNGNSGNNNSGVGVASKGVCAISKGGFVSFQISAPAGAVFECRFRAKGTTSYASFGIPGSYDSANSRWVCSDWGAGNPNYDVQLSVDGVNFDTDEPIALANSCP